MKRKFTTQKSANRHPHKYNFNEIETMPVVERRRRQIFSFDSATHDADIKAREEEKARRAAAKSNNA